MDHITRNIVTSGMKGRIQGLEKDILEAEVKFIKSIIATEMSTEEQWMYEQESINLGLIPGVLTNLSDSESPNLSWRKNPDPNKR